MARFFATEEIGEDLDQGPEYDEGQSAELESDAATLAADILDDFDNIDLCNETVLVLESLMEAKKNGLSGIALEGYGHAGSIASLRTGMDPTFFVDHSLSLEELAVKRDTFLQKLRAAIKGIGQKMLDYTHYNYSILEFQTSRLTKLEQSLRQKTAGRVDIQVPGNKWMRVGTSGTNSRVLKSFGEYRGAFADTSAVLGSVADAFVEIGKVDIFGWWKAVGSTATGNSTEYIEKRTELLDQITKRLISIKSVKKESSWKPEYDIYASEVLLGLFQIEVYVPDVTESSLLKVKVPYIHVERLAKTNGPDFFKSKVDLSFDKNEALNLLKDAKSLLARTKGLGSFAQRWAQWGTESQINNPVGLYSSALTSAGRVSMAIGGMVLSGTSPIYNLGFGNVKQAATIVEKYLKQAK